MKEKVNSSSSSTTTATVVKTDNANKHLKEDKENKKTPIPWPLMVLFNAAGDTVFQLNSPQGNYHGAYDYDNGQTIIQFPGTGTWYPTTNEQFYLHRYDTWFTYDRVAVYEVAWSTTLGHFMAVQDGTGPSLDSSSSSSTTTTTTVKRTTLPPQPPHTLGNKCNWEMGNFRRPVTEKQLKRRVGDDIPVPVFAIFDGDEFALHKMSTPNLLFDIDYNSYHMASCPVALTYLDIYYAIDIESYSEYYTYVVRVANTCSVNGAVAFLIAGRGASTVQATCPLGRQLQASIPNEAVHQGVRCSGCGQSPLTGVRFQCCECKNLDLCSSCEEKQLTPYRHNTEHNMLKIKTPIVPRTVHTGVTCDNCKISPIEGTRYKCQTCDDFDLCEKCERTTDHPSNHPLIKAKHLLK